MKYGNSFKINITVDETITLKRAIRLARKADLAQFPYDPLGLNNEQSWYWCAGILDSLKQESIIESWDILVGPDVSVESKPGVVY